MTHFPSNIKLQCLLPVYYQLQFHCINEKTIKYSIHCSEIVNGSHVLKQNELPPLPLK